MMTADRIIHKGIKYMGGNKVLAMGAYYPTRCMEEAKRYPRASQLNNQRHATLVNEK